jgi:uncharacterized membrane protein HdeD (DUF308 family)
MGIYLLGYVILMAGIFAGLWKMGVLDRIGSTWTLIAVVIAVGFGIMIAVSGSGEKRTVDVDHR